MGASLHEVIACLSPAYRSIDLRGIIVSVGDGWRNITTVVRFSSETPAQIDEKHRELISDLQFPQELLRTQLGSEHNIDPFLGLNIELSSYTPDEFGDLVRRASEGILAVRTRAVRMSDSPRVAIPLETASPYFANDGELLGVPDMPIYEWRWRTKDSSWTTANDDRVDESTLDAQLRAAGLRPLRDVAEDVTGLPWHSSDSLHIILPVNLSIEVETSSKHVRVTGGASENLAPIDVDIDFSTTARDGRLRNTRPKRGLRPQIVEPAAGPGQYRFLAQTEVPTSETPLVAEVTAYRRSPVRVELFYNRYGVPSGDEQFSALGAFISQHDVSEYLQALEAGRGLDATNLFSKYSPTNPGKKTEELLERVTALLLALSRLNPVLLSPGFDVLAGGLSAGSADILARSPEGHSVLVACTMGMPDDRRAGMVRAARTAIAARGDVETARIRLVLVTGKPDTGRQPDDITYVSAQGLRDAWQAIVTGNTTRAQSIFGLPDRTSPL